jgi:hypothetical protein
VATPRRALCACAAVGSVEPDDAGAFAKVPRGQAWISESANLFATFETAMRTTLKSYAGHGSACTDDLRTEPNLERPI